MKREPPVEYRFKKGQSGNLKGRPRKIEKEKEVLFIVTKVLHLAYKALNSDKNAIIKII